jgi:hypothetical protein
MPKASLTLENGTVVTLDGTVPEIHELLSFYGPKKQDRVDNHANPATARRTAQKTVAPKPETPHDEVDLVAIVNHIKSCDETENIETHILDQSEQLPRVLLPMYTVYEHMNNVYGLTSGQISKVTIQLGVPVKISNVSTTLSAAAKYVIGDTVRKTGQAVRYKLSRRGHAYLKEIISGPKAR